MRLTTEIAKDEKATLIVGNPQMRIIHHLAQELRSKDVSVLLSSHIPPTIPDNVHRVFCFSELKEMLHDLKKLSGVENIVFLSVLDEKLNKKTEEVVHFVLKHNPHIKIALIPKGEHELEVITHKLLTFTFSEREQYTILHAKPDPAFKENTKVQTVIQSQNSAKNTYPPHIWVLKHPKKSIFMIFLAVLAVHVIFILPLIASFLLFGGQILASNANYSRFLPEATKLSQMGRSTFNFSKSLYFPVKRGWLFVGLAPSVDKVFDTVSATLELETLAKKMKDDAGIMLSRIFDPQSTDIDQIESRKEALITNLEKVKNNLDTLEANLPDNFINTYKLDVKISKAKEYMSIANIALERFDEIFGKTSPKTYALFFANNHELRPGGGFIGSFALIKTEKLKIQEWRIYDVYDADGQLKARVIPPAAISTYLRQPFFFLRDSAFSPDFPTNAIVAEDFLKKELGINGIDGAFMITFSSIEKMIQELGPIYIPEYKTTITYENAYYKTQTFAEENFFPGSTQKKDFLDTLVSEIMLKFSEPKDAAKILLSLRGSFDEKRVAGYFKDDIMQNVFDEYHWSGRQLTPTCIKSVVSANENCVAAYVFPVEANLGVNKANAYMRRSYELNTKVGADGRIESEFITKFSNSSIKDVFPGGPYKNYYQIYLPPNTTILSVQKDNSFVSKYDIENTNYTRFGYLVKVPESKTVTLTVRYRLKETLGKTDSTLQTIIQKQIGLPESNLTLRFNLPESYVYKEANFSPLALPDLLEYNSSVDSDKIYYLHF